MAAKRNNRVMVRLDDDTRAEIVRYSKWVAEQMPGVTLSEAECVRALVGRGVRDWQREVAYLKGKKTRVT